MAQPSPAVIRDQESIAVAVVTYNSAHLLADLVDSLVDGLDGVRWQLVVADNASRDETVATLQRLAPAATLVQTGRNAGYAAGINAAVAAADPYTAILVLNPDIRLEPGCGAALLDALRTEGTGIAVPLLHDGEGNRLQSLRREPTALRMWAGALIGTSRAGRFPRLGETVTDERHYASENVSDWAEGSIMLISGECWASCGGWDESFFLYSEETDFALRARDEGFAMRFTPRARAIHLEGQSRTSPQLFTLLTLNKVRLHRRRHGPLSTAAFWGALVLRELTRSMLGRETDREAVRALLSPSRLRERPGPDRLAPRHRERTRTR